MREEGVRKEDVDEGVEVGVLVPCADFPPGETVSPTRQRLHLGGEPGPAVCLLALSVSGGTHSLQFCPGVKGGGWSLRPLLQWLCPQRLEHPALPAFKRSKIGAGFSRRGREQGNWQGSLGGCELRTLPSLKGPSGHRWVYFSQPGLCGGATRE